MKKILTSVLIAAIACTTVFAGGKKEESSGTGMEKRLVLYSSMTENDIDHLIEIFNEKYPDTEIEVVNGSGGELTARIRAEKDNPQGDIMWGALGNSDGDVNSDIFEHYLSPSEDEVMPDYRSNNGFYNLDHLSSTVICVNTDLEKELGVTIKGYSDLLNPKLKGRIVLSDPNSSSAAWNNLQNIFAVYGNDSPEAWNYMEALLKNGLVISTSSSVCFKSVQTGEYVAGLTYEDGASTLLKSGATNIKMVYMAEGASANAFGCAVVANCKHPNAAKAMVDLLMSADGQSKLGSALGTLRFTNSKATYNSPYLPASSSIKWVSRDVKWLTEHKKAILEHWNNLYTSTHK